MAAMNERPLDEHYASIPIYLVATILTLGIFNLYWNWRQMQACNDMLRREEFAFVTWLLLSIITCGLYHLYYQYKMGSALVEIQRASDAAVFEELPVVSLLAAIFGVGVVADCIHQHEINKLVELL